MLNLDRIIQDYPRKYASLPRKNEPQGVHNFTLFGAPKVGKTTILHRWLWDNAKQGKGAYIDLNDWRYENVSFNELINFASQRNLTHLAIDNAPNILHSIENLSIAATIKNKQKIDGFEFFELKALDFEEFMAFEKHGARISDDNSLATMFGLFAQIGNLPEKLNIPEAKRAEFLQKQMSGLCKNETSKEILKELSSNQAHSLSILQLFAKLKQKCKLSKDFLYSEVDFFESINLISFVHKFDSIKSSKKLYFADFILPSLLVGTKDYLRLFENAVFCEIDSDEIYYTDNTNFYLPKNDMAIIARPFDDEDAIIARAKKIIIKEKALNLKYLHIVTNHIHLEYEQNGVEIIAEPFWSWAIQK